MSRYGASINRYRAAGLGLIALFGVSFGFWAALAPLSSAVIAIGHFEVTGSIKKVQHESGGTVAEILVRDGDRVAENQLVVLLDQTTTRANLEIVQGKLDELWMAAARLRAERDGLAAISLPRYFAGREQSAEVMALLATEERLFAVRASARTGQKDQLSKRIDQLNSQIAGLRTQESAKAKELGLASSDLERARALATQDVVPLSRVEELEGVLARLEGEQGQIVAAIAELGGKIAETRLQALNIDQAAIAEAGRELNDTEGGIAEFTQRRVAAADLLAKTEIRSPIAGFVHQLAVHTLGGVVGPGEVLLTVVPSDGLLDIEARISPQDVDAVHVGEAATVRLSGLNGAAAPELEAIVTLVGADLVQDPATRLSYFPVTLNLAPGQLERIKGIELLPGMPAEAFIATSERTFLDYLVQPIRDRMSRALREQ